MLSFVLIPGFVLDLRDKIRDQFQPCESRTTSENIVFQLLLHAAGGVRTHDFGLKVAHLQVRCRRYAQLRASVLVSAGQNRRVRDMFRTRPCGGFRAHAGLRGRPRTRIRLGSITTTDPALLTEAIVHGACRAPRGGRRRDAVDLTSPVRDDATSPSPGDHGGRWSETIDRRRSGFESSAVVRMRRQKRSMSGQ
jgi:hypothetical protein